ncbi:MAG: adenylosuccinate lyase [Verrucomicrobia bacterium]|nr:adenylosuccinate lyase [Verrucomicrobiota bacterium]
MGHELYADPLIERYASREMAALFSDDAKFRTWRRLWVALAKAEQALGLPIADEQIAELEAHVNDINYDVANAKERELRHDVMAHVAAYGAQCPKAKGIIHLGATSAYVGDNTDLIQMREALRLVQARLAACLRALAAFAREHQALPTLGFTHFQPAQLTTVGKRACLWLQDLVLDYREVSRRLDELPFRGIKGATGTQASFLELFDGDHAKVVTLDAMVAEAMGFLSSLVISGQTYTRKIDTQVLEALAGIGESAHKLTNDVRLLCHLREVEEPFEKSQVGSSAMAYKRNPMRSERAASLSRYLMSLVANAQQTAATQWLERTLDDSANRRITIPHAFLAADAVLKLIANIAGGLIVRPEVIRARVEAELPFIATEAVLMEGVKRGGDRQALHERIRDHSMKAAERIKTGQASDLTERLAGDQKHFGLSRAELDELMRPEHHIGRAPEQVEQYLRETVQPLLQGAPTEPGGGAVTV